MNYGSQGARYSSLLRGVVLRIRYADQAAMLDPRCDVLVYGGSHANRCAVLNNVMLSFDGMDMHDGSLVLPRPSTNIPGDLKDVELGSLDGSHVLVGILHGTGEGVILRYLFHPRSDSGKAPTDHLGQRVRPSSADVTSASRPRILRHNGVRVEIKDDGSVEVDTTESRADYTNGVDTPDPSTSAGPITIRVRGDAAITVQGGSLVVDTTTATIGTGATHPVVHGDALASVFSSFDTQLTTLLTAIQTAVGTIPGGTGAAASIGSAITTAIANGLLLAATPVNSTDVLTK